MRLNELPPLSLSDNLIVDNNKIVKDKTVSLLNTIQPEAAQTVAKDKGKVKPDSRRKIEYSKTSL